jgi:iron complex transport system permease protein
MASISETSPQQRRGADSERSQIRVMERRGFVVLILLSIALVAAVIVSAGTGQVTIHPDQAITILLDRFGIRPGFDLAIPVGDGVFNIPAEYESPRQDGVLLNIRLPRVTLAVLIGASLAAAGTLIQGMFRNPLADPGLIGISGGAAFFAALAIVFGLSAYLPFAAFIGGLITTFSIYQIATIAGRTNVATMLLAGIALNAMAGAGIGMLISQTGDAEIRDITFWNLGSLVGATWEKVRLVLPFIVVAVAPMFLLARPLNALLLGDMEAEHLGFNVERTKQLIVIIAAVAVGAGVAVAGIIGFIGLVVPHLTRMLVGPDHRYVIPGSALLGSILLVCADLIARSGATGEIPLGVVTALIGAPFFIFLLLRDRRRRTLA